VKEKRYSHARFLILGRFQSRDLWNGYNAKTQHIATPSRQPTHLTSAKLTNQRAEIFRDRVTASLHLDHLRQSERVTTKSSQEKKKKKKKKKKTVQHKSKINKKKNKKKKKK